MFLRPSLLSLNVTTLVTFAIIALVNWPYVAADPWLYDAFYGNYGIITILEQSPNIILLLILPYHFACYHGVLVWRTLAGGMVLPYVESTVYYYSLSCTSMSL
jgi:hypothetical protein